jgi:hypothetical protein
MAAPVKEIKFLAVARRSDKALLCHRIHSADKSYDYIANVQKVLNSPGWASITTDKLSLDDGGNMFYVLIDEVRRAAAAGAAWATGRSGPPRKLAHAPRGRGRGRGGPVARLRRASPRERSHPPSRPVFFLSSQQGRVFIVITTKGYPSRYIYSSSDGNTRGVLGGGSSLIATQENVRTFRVPYAPRLIPRPALPTPR